MLVRLRAAPLNFRDIAVASGRYPGPTFPIVPVADGAGEIAALGDGVEDWAVGDRVFEMRAAAAAYAHLAEGRSHFGKIAIDVGDWSII